MSFISIPKTRIKTHIFLFASARIVDYSLTGTGFRPKRMLVFSGLPGASASGNSRGLDDGSDRVAISQNPSSGLFEVSNDCCYQYGAQKYRVKSFDADGFTWESVSGTPQGSTTLTIMCEVSN